MNLVDQLQVSAQQDDVLKVLRRTMMVASKLRRQDISEWLQAELNGYPESSVVPSYRMVNLVFAFTTNGFVPVGTDRILTQAIPTVLLSAPVRIGNSISYLQGMISDHDKGQEMIQPAMQAVGHTLRTQDSFDPMLYSQVNIRVRLNHLEVRAIPERVKDRVLEWALALERGGVKGEDLSFTEREQEIARSTTFNLNDCHVEQLSNSGISLKGS
jgi:hypothetical protein